MTKFSGRALSFRTKILLNCALGAAILLLTTCEATVQLCIGRDGRPATCAYSCNNGAARSGRPEGNRVVEFCASCNAGYWRTSANTCAINDGCRANTDTAATNILVLYGDQNWSGYAGADCSAVTYSGSRNQDFDSAATTEIEDLTTGCYEDTPECISLNRVGGAWGGWHYDLDPTVDVTSFQSLCVAYKLEASSDAAGFTFVLEDPARVVGDITTQSRIEISAGDLTDDDTWRVLRIARSGFSVPGVHDEVDNFGIWNTTDGEALVIDEVYFSSAATCLP